MTVSPQGQIIPARRNSRQRDATGTPRSKLLRAALSFAHRGIPVFPCRPGSKEPLTPKGFHDATTDRSRIHAWWSRWPRANIGVPTGERSGLLVLDVDRDRWGFGTLSALEDEHGGLPETTTVKTGGDGLHVYFKFPTGSSIRNSADRLGLGLDVRAAGGYVIVPPSTTEGGYQWLERRTLAEVPAWITAALTEPKAAPQGRVSRHTATATHTATLSIEVDGPPIPQGARDDQLTRICGRLHDGTRNLDQLGADLMGINEARCAPPLAEDQVLKIAASIHRREPCKAGGASPEVKEALSGAWSAFWRWSWPKMAGKSARDCMRALLELAEDHGELVEGGVKVSAAIRELERRAAIGSRSTVLRALRALQDSGLIRRDGRGSGPKSGAFILTRAKLNHSSSGGGSGSSGSLLRGGLRSPYFRWSAPEIKRLGKSCGAALTVIEHAGGEISVTDLAAALHVARPRDLRRRVVDRLVGAAVVECDGETVRLTADWLRAAEEAREMGREHEAARLQKARHRREGEAFREAWARGEVISITERRKRERWRRMKAEREGLAPVPEVSGEHAPEGVAEPDPLPEAPPELVEALAYFMARNPHRRDERPSWLATAVWADELVTDKPTPELVEAALTFGAVAA